jgi:ribosomal protein L11 methyltransferase
MNQKQQKINLLPDQFRCFEVSVPNDEGERAYALLDRLTGMPIVSITEHESTQTRLRIYFPSPPLKVRGVRGVMKKEITPPDSPYFKGRDKDDRVSLVQLKRSFQLHFPTDHVIKTYLLKDWKEKWKRGLEPRKVTPHLWVCPSWKKIRPQKGEKVIRLDPGMAFGTGLHPTTRFVLKMIDRFYKNIHSLLDVGTGSGILAIGANRLGIREIIAIDFDPESIEAAAENFKKNRCFSIRLKRSTLEKFRSKKRFCFVAANLETRILLKAKKRLLSWVSSGGWIAITGIGNASRNKVLRHYRSKNLKCVAQFRGREWSGFCFVVRNAPYAANGSQYA